MQINENEIAKLVQSVLSEMTAGNAEAPKPAPQVQATGEPKKIPTYASFMAGTQKSAAPKA